MLESRELLRYRPRYHQKKLRQRLEIDAAAKKRTRSHETGHLNIEESERNLTLGRFEEFDRFLTVFGRGEFDTLGGKVPKRVNEVNRQSG